MAETYTHEYSNFPDEVIELTNYRNVDDTIGNLINQIEQLRQNGDYDEAAALISQYSSQLKKYTLGNDKINAIVEEIRNTQIKSRTSGQFLSIDDEEPAPDDNGFVWIGGDSKTSDKQISISETEPSTDYGGFIWVGGE